MKSIKQLKKEGMAEGQQELQEKYGDISTLPSLPDANASQIDETTQQPIIAARDAEIGKDYLTVGMYYKITLLQKYGDEENVSSVQVQAEGSYKPIAIAGGTDLIAYQETFHKPRVVDIPDLENETSTKPPKEKKSMPTKEKASKSAEPKLKMSSIILPMLAAAKHTAAEIADAVIKSFPEKKGDRDKLISQIEGPRLYNMLKNKEQWEKGKTPAVKEDAAKVAAKTAAKKEKAEKVPPKKEKASKKDKKAAVEEVVSEAPSVE